MLPMVRVGRKADAEPVSPDVYRSLILDGAMSADAVGRSVR